MSKSLRNIDQLSIDTPIVRTPKFTVNDKFLTAAREQSKMKWIYVLLIAAIVAQIYNAVLDKQVSEAKIDSKIACQRKKYIKIVTITCIVLSAIIFFICH